MGQPQVQDLRVQERKTSVRDTASASESSMLMVEWLIEIVRRHFYWPGMAIQVREFFWGYELCKTKTDASRDTKKIRNWRPF